MMFTSSQKVSERFSSMVPSVWFDWDDSILLGCDAYCNVHKPTGVESHQSILSSGMNLEVASCVPLTLCDQLAD